mmetsp:Transcript_39154/g.111866  ORF Transcript_39154/g.111866 Transcript_39154/m.111866 type:complete len:221 (-) Transcript_39154:387-1049(-)
MMGEYGGAASFWDTVQNTLGHGAQHMSPYVSLSVLHRAYPLSWPPRLETDRDTYTGRVTDTAHSLTGRQADRQAGRQTYRRSFLRPKNVNQPGQPLSFFLWFLLSFLCEGYGIVITHRLPATPQQKDHRTPTTPTSTHRTPLCAHCLSLICTRKKRRTHHSTHSTTHLSRINQSTDQPTSKQVKEHQSPSLGTRSLAPSLRPYTHLPPFPYMREPASHTL